MKKNAGCFLTSESIALVIYSFRWLLFSLLVYLAIFVVHHSVNKMSEDYLQNISITIPKAKSNSDICLTNSLKLNNKLKKQLILQDWNSQGWKNELMQKLK